MLVNHCGVSVADYEKSKAFYTPLIKLLGYDVTVEYPGQYIGYDNHSFGVAKNIYDHPNRLHVAFNAKSREQVDEFYEKALQLGGKCNGKPGIRAEYAPNYYAAFIHDFDNNNVEVVYFPDPTTTEK